MKKWKRIWFSKIEATGSFGRDIINDSITLNDAGQEQSES